MRPGRGAFRKVVTELHRLTVLCRADDEVVESQLPAQEKENENTRRDQKLAHNSQDADPAARSTRGETTLDIESDTASIYGAGANRAAVPRQSRMLQARVVASLKAST